jgi:segregation and condensation protein A
MQPPAYQVMLPVFEGPLDLLLHLIEHRELDITEISLAQVTNQFLDYVGHLGERDADSLAGFLVVAAKLLVIKSRVLLPQAPTMSPPEEEEVGQDLVQQLIDYRRFRDAAQWLRGIEAQGMHSYVRLAAPPHLEQSLDLGEHTLQDLLAAVRQALQIKPPEPSVNGALPPLTVTLADRVALILEETARNRTVSFLSLVRQATSRLELIVTLLALLEVVKQRRVSMRQDVPFGDISIWARPPEDSAAAQPALAEP